MIGKKYFLLQVDENKAEALMEALSQRNYIKSIDLTSVSTRSKFEECPACERKFSRESTIVVTDEMLESMLSLLSVMKTYRSAVFFHAKKPKEELRSIDHPRSCFFPHYLINKAEMFGLIEKFVDGTQDTYYATAKSLRFLSGKEALSPARLITAEGVLLEASGSVLIDDVKSKDKIKLHGLVEKCREAVRAVPDSIRKFVETGQTSLI